VSYGKVYSDSGERLMTPAEIVVRLQVLQEETWASDRELDAIHERVARLRSAALERNRELSALRALLGP
jgi:hypothetical protein